MSMEDISSSSSTTITTLINEYKNIILENKWIELYYQPFIYRYYNKLDWKQISSNPNITMTFINNHPEYSWSQEYISSNPNLTIKMINNHPDKDWDWQYLIRHLNITMIDIENNIHLPWVWSECGISDNPNLTMDMINNYPDKNWNWYDISSNLIRIGVGVTSAGMHLQ